MVRASMPRRPIWLWPNLLSLDAPLVALAWFWMFKQAWRIPYTPTLMWFLAIVVWCVYVADRLIDERMAAMGAQEQTPRHRFHGRNRKPLTMALMLGTIAAMVLLAMQPRGLWEHGSFVVVLLVGYFTMAFLDSDRGISYSKNILAGLAFGYGSAVGVHFYGGETLASLLVSPEVIGFGVLCFLNITAIDHWEESDRTRDPEVKAGHELILTLLLIALAALAIVFAAFLSDVHRRPLFVAILVSAGALYFLNRVRSRFSLDAQRVLADVCMLLPLPVFFSMQVMLENQ